jgi:hypothetical protein
MAGWKQFSPDCCPCGTGPPCGTICITASGCGSGIADATITINRQSDGLFIGSCTSDGTGKCCVPIASADTYDATIAVTGWATRSVSIVAACVTNNVAISLDPPTIKFTVKGCNNLPLEGAIVTVLKSGVSIGSGTTDAAGNVTVSVTGYNGSALTATFTATRFSTLTFALLPDKCTYEPRTMLAASGFVCCENACSTPISTTLHATADGESVTLNYLGGNLWVGCYTKTMTGWVLGTNPYGDCGMTLQSGTFPFQFIYSCNFGATIFYPAFSQYYYPTQPSGPTPDILFYPTHFAYYCLDSSGGFILPCNDGNYVCSIYGEFSDDPGAIDCANGYYAPNYRFFNHISSGSNSVTCSPFLVSGTATGNGINFTPSFGSIDWTVTE